MERSGEGREHTPLALVMGERGRTTVARLLAAMARSGGAPLEVLEVDADAIAGGAPTPPPADVAVMTRSPARCGPAAALFEIIERAERLVLNADDPECRNLARAADRPITWYAVDPRNPLARDHMDRGGDACLLEGDTIALCAGDTCARVASVREIPLALGGAARHQVANALAAVGAAVGLGLSLAAVRAGLAAVHAPSHFRLGGASILVDRPPDRTAAEALLRTAAELPAERRRALFLRRDAADSPQLFEAARMAGIEVLPPGDLRGALGECAAGDLLLVLAADETPLGCSEEDLLRSAQAAGWTPGAPLPA